MLAFVQHTDLRRLPLILPVFACCHSSRRFTATALEPTELVVILRNDFEDLVANRPDFIPTYNLGSASCVYFLDRRVIRFCWRLSD